MIVKGLLSCSSSLDLLQLLAARGGIPQDREGSAALTGPDACPGTNKLWRGGRTIANDGSSFNKATGWSQGDVIPGEGDTEQTIPMDMYCSLLTLTLLICKMGTAIVTTL